MTSPQWPPHPSDFEEELRKLTEVATEEYREILRPYVALQQLDRAVEEAVRKALDVAGRANAISERHRLRRGRDKRGE